MFGRFQLLVGHYCSYLLPHCPGKMVELIQQEVFTNEMGHPVPAGTANGQGHVATKHEVTDSQPKYF